MKYTLPIFFVLLLMSCRSENNTQSITSTLLNQSKSEYSIISATGTNTPMIFSLTSNGSPESIEFWVDHYIDGNYQGEILKLHGYTNDKKKETRLYFFSRNIDANEQMWTLSLRQDSENSVSQVTLKMNNGKSFISNYNVYPKVTIVKGTENAIGRIVFIGDNAQNIEKDDNEEAVIKKGHEVFIVKCRMM
ncbi:hypothetical protein [Cohnella mopanensis]|uniref:hypothetical protein n=1 Tax=Cohnella mopanensis TaxID=2911966 RepID=UPI001EF7CE97|nr:hypothetical protein [Cohnella mopanensis]